MDTDKTWTDVFELTEEQFVAFWEEAEATIRRLLAGIDLLAAAEEVSGE